MKPEVRWSASGLPSGATANYDGSGHLTDISISSLGQGEYAITYTVSDGSSSVNGTIDLDVVQKPSNGGTLNLTTLGTVNNVNFNQSIFQRLIGVGNLLIESGGNDSAEPFTNISRPETVQNIIHRAMDERMTQAFRPAPARGDIADQLERLEGLRDRGALTDEEFEQQKRRLLG